jgi:hypothetical protein
LDGIPSGEARPVEYARAAELLAGGDWYELDPPVLVDLFRRKHGALTPLAQAKLFFTQEVSGPPPDRSLRDPWLFEKLACAFAGVIPDFEVWQPLGTEDLLEAVTRLRELVPGKVANLRDEIWAYIGASLLNDGCWCPPPGLEPAGEPIRVAMAARGVTLPDQVAVESGPDDDSKNQRDIWAAARERLGAPA